LVFQFLGPNVPEIAISFSREPRQVENATAEVFRLQQQEKLGIPMRKGLLDTSDVGTKSCKSSRMLTVKHGRFTISGEGKFP